MPKKIEATCPECKKSKGFVFKKDVNKLCRSCARKKVHSNFSKEMKEHLSKMTSKTFTGVEPWNKGKRGVYSKDLIKQWSKKQSERMKDKNNRKLSGNGRRRSWIRGKELPHDVKVKISCAHRGIPIDSFDDFKHIERDQDRRKFDYLGFSIKVFKRDDFTCQLCNGTNLELNAHHLNGFDNFPDQRFDMDNLITLCKSCHDNFHDQCGRGGNTKEQFIEHKQNLSKHKPV
jgi:hypothetical protein